MRAREWTTVGLTMLIRKAPKPQSLNPAETKYASTHMWPSLMSFLTPILELAFEISAASFGSSQTVEERGKSDLNRAKLLEADETILTLPGSDTGDRGSEPLLNAEIRELGHVESCEEKERETGQISDARETSKTRGIVDLEVDE